MKRKIESLSVWNTFSHMERDNRVHVCRAHLYKRVLFVISASYNKISSGHRAYLDLINPPNHFSPAATSDMYVVNITSMLSVCNLL